MPNRFHFTKKMLLEIAFPESRKQCSFHDMKSRGLILLVSGSTKTFYVLRKVEGRTERVKIGRFPDTTIEQARKQAAQINLQIDAGRNPNERKRDLRYEMTFGELFELFMKRHYRVYNRSPDQAEDTHRRLLSHLDKRRISNISQYKLSSLHQQIAERSGQRSANIGLNLVRSMYNRAKEWGIWQGENPTTGIKRFREVSRSRYLTAAEMPVFLAALEDDENEDVKDFIKLLLFTGTRRSEMLNLVWSAVKFESRQIHLENTKSGEPRYIPMSEKVHDLLYRRHITNNSLYVFPMDGEPHRPMGIPKRAWHRIIDRAGIDNLRIHDLRHTVATWMISAGASTILVGKALGHKSIQSTAVYAHADTEPLRTMLDVTNTAMLKK